MSAAMNAEQPGPADMLANAHMRWDHASRMTDPTGAQLLVLEAILESNLAIGQLLLEIRQGKGESWHDHQ
jgi:hypothetical protein